MASISQNMCRICENNSKKLIDVSASQNQSLIDKYLSCANVNFDITDKLPKYFCETCIDLLNISHNFKEQCEKTYSKLMWQSMDLPSVDGIKQENVMIVEENVVEEEIDDFYKKIIDFEELSSSSKIKNKRVNKKIANSNVFDKNLIKNELTINEMNKIVCKVEKLLQPENSKNVKRKRYPKKLSSKTYECYMCKDHTYKSKQAFVFHMETKHKFGINENDEKIKLKCDICDKVYSYRPHLIRHYKTKHLESDKPKIEIPCEMCGKLFSNAANQRRHIREIHNQEKPHECELCGSRFSQLTVLQSHIKTHSQARNFKCNRCDKSFKTKIAMENHVYIHLPKEERPIRIQRKNQYSNKLIKICEICGKSMASTCIYPHMRKHNGIKMHECQVCLKKFLHKNELVVHNLIHTGERPHKCEMCPKTFRQWAHLFEHIKTHTGDRPHKCRFCEKAFSMAGNLREHERIHTGETPYSCNLCSQRFTNLKALRRHAKSFHPENEAAAVTTKSKGEILNISQL